MNWLEVRVDTTPEALDAVCELLLSAGAGGVDIRDAGEFRRFLDASRPDWDYVEESLLRDMAEGPTRVTAYLADGPAGRDCLAAIRDALERLRRLAEDPGFGLDPGTLALDVARRDGEDWEIAWKRHFTPFPVGKRLFVLPAWLPEPPGLDRTVFRLEPGALFGTGLHATTRLCLEEIETRLQPGMRVLDLGCGTGILSVVALQLGAGSAVAADRDPAAGDIARDNALRNGVPLDRYRVLAGDLLDETAGNLLQQMADPPADLVLANIVADVLIPLVPRIPGLLAPGGVFVLSGILVSRVGEMAAALHQAGFAILSRRDEEDWTCLACRPADKGGLPDDAHHREKTEIPIS